jgi:hypothetical protein
MSTRLWIVASGSLRPAGADPAGQFTVRAYRESANAHRAFLRTVARLEAMKLGAVRRRCHGDEQLVRSGERLVDLFPVPK